jgi:peptide deformylase
MNIIKFPSCILREKIPEFDFTDPFIDPKQFEKDMLETMYAHNGVGLAANQVGYPVRMFVMGHRDSPELGQAFFNPIVISNTTDINDTEEGCLSFPNIYVNIKRPTAIIAGWQNSSGEYQEKKISGYDCKCFLHELDHLEGIVFRDRVSPLRWAMAVKKSKSTKRTFNVRTK